MAVWAHTSHNQTGLRSAIFAEHTVVTNTQTYRYTRGPRYTCDESVAIVRIYSLSAGNAA